MTPEVAHALATGGKVATTTGVYTATGVWTGVVLALIATIGTLIRTKSKRDEVTNARLNTLDESRAADMAIMRAEMKELREEIRAANDRAQAANDRAQATERASAQLNKAADDRVNEVRIQLSDLHTACQLMAERLRELNPEDPVLRQANTLIKKAVSPDMGWGEWTQHLAQTPGLSRELGGRGDSA